MKIKCLFDKHEYNTIPVCYTCNPILETYIMKCKYCNNHMVMYKDNESTYKDKLQIHEYYGEHSYKTKFKNLHVALKYIGKLNRKNRVIIKTIKNMRTKDGWETITDE